MYFTTTCLQALAKDGVIDENSVTIKTLEEQYNYLIKQVDESVDSQLNLLANIQVILYYITYNNV